MTEKQLARLAPQQERYLTIRDFIKRNEREVQAVAASHLNPERLMSLILSHTKRNDLLLECTPESLLECVLRCARLGIEPTAAPGGMYIVPFKTSKMVKGAWTNVYVATPITDYRAEIDLASRTGLCQAVEPRIVYEGDVFEHLEGTEPKLIHKPGEHYQEQGKELLVYARALLPSNAYSAECLYKGEIERRRKLSRSGENKNSPWQVHYWRMALKSSVRALTNRLPKSTRFYREPLAQAWVEHIHKETAAEMGMDETPELETGDTDTPPASATDGLAAKIARKTKVDESQEAWEKEQARRADEELG